MMVKVKTNGIAARVARQFLIAGAALAVMAFAAPFALAQSDAEESPEDYPAGPGRDDTFYACTACHGFKLVAQQGMNRAQWDDSINLMISKHNMPKPEAAEREVILNYLEQTFPQRTTPSGGGFRNPFTQ
ncbi:MAG TPA: hypothetical protein VNZ94_03220 [Xanthobacteraceae bacterium]|nr:hypothetical protein [Xanthobacteraceae bacterium]